MSDASATALEQLARDCRTAGLHFDAAWSPQLARMIALLGDAARSQNLVGDPTPAGICGHIAEAISTVAVVTRSGVEPLAVADVGAGAGVEAVVLALAFPTAAVFAVEPRRLRAEFIGHVKGALGLHNLHPVQATLHGALARNLLPNRMDVATARAVWPLQEWVAKATPLVGPHGVIVVHGRGPLVTLQAELAALGALRAACLVPGDRGYAVAALAPTTSAAT